MYVHGIILRYTILKLHRTELLPVTGWPLLHSSNKISNFL